MDLPKNIFEKTSHYTTLAVDPTSGSTLKLVNDIIDGVPRATFEVSCNDDIISRNTQISTAISDFNDAASSRTFEFDRLTNVELEGINREDYPEFCDAYVGSAEFDGIPLTDRQLDLLNENSDLVYRLVEKYLN